MAIKTVPMTLAQYKYAYRKLNKQYQARVAEFKGTRLEQSRDAQRIRDLEMQLGESQRRAKEQVQQKQLTIEMLEKHLTEHKVKVSELEYKLHTTEAALEEMQGWNTSRLDEIEALEEENGELKEIVRKLAGLI